MILNNYTDEDAGYIMEVLAEERTSRLIGVE
jgi:hypothetical protein